MQNEIDPKVAAIVATIIERGVWTTDDGRYEFSAPDDTWEIWVKDLQTGQHVAHSSMRSDFDQSLVEFIGDYALGR